MLIEWLTSSTADQLNLDIRCSRLQHRTGNMTDRREPEMVLTDDQIRLRMRAVDHAIAQQTLEGLTVSAARVEDLRRAARGDIPSEQAIRNIYARFTHVPLFEPRRVP